MALTTDQMKSWVEDLIGKNRILEEENKSLMNVQRISAEAGGQGQGHGQEQEKNIHIKFNILEQEFKDFKSDTVNKMDSLEQENQTLKLKILELMGKLEILEQKISNGFGGQDRKDNPPPREQRRRRIGSDGGAPVVSSDKEMTTVIVNPLEVEKIVRIIMGHVKPMDLLKCRQVSKLWKNAAEKDFQEKMIFHINTKDFMYDEIDFFLTDCARSFPALRNLNLDLEDRPSRHSLQGIIQLFANHGKSLHNLRLNFTGHKWTLADFRDIFMSSLDEIRELKINMLCHFINEDQMFFPHHVKKILPNLTTLNIELDCACNFSHHVNTQVFADLLTLFPNLKTLHWDACGYEDDEQDWSKNFIQSLLLINPIKLENLFIYSAIADGLACSIANSNLNLKQLSLTEFCGFGLHFFSRPTGERKKCEVTLYSSDDDSQALKIHLENALAKAGNVSCTKLLQRFASTLNNKLNEMKGN